jgi:transcriptional regulator with XRE-family HTH domain
MATNKLDLGSRIKQLRRQKGLTQDDLAEAAGIDSKSISRLENNRFNPALDTLENLAVALNIQIQDFFTPNTESPKALRGYLFEVISTASDKEVIQLADAVRRVITKRKHPVRKK